MGHYERVAEVIRFLDENYHEQPSLEYLARRAGLSASRFHRVFSEWAGVTPKDFLQSLTLEDAKSRLRAGSSVLDSALESGLSGPSRLHDLCVGLEAATPGEIKSGGKGWTIVWGVAETPFGEALFAKSPRGLCRLSFLEDDRGRLVSSLQDEWFAASFERDESWAVELSRTIFSGDENSVGKRGLKACVKGTEFQLKVWRALLEIPEGALCSYRRIAEFLGNEGASRAVGSAVGQNPVGYLIPCHRVIRESGALGGYRWGLIRKKAMLARETALAAV